MRWPLQAAVFGAAYLTSIQLPNRAFKFVAQRDVTQEMAMSSTDLVGRFRLFENGAPQASVEQSLVNYLHEYSDRPFVKDELIEKLNDMQKKGIRMRIRRMGKDLDDLYWHFGKIHGLENIAFAEEAELKEVNGDPIALQLLVNKYDGRGPVETSFEELQVKND